MIFFQVGLLDQEVKEGYVAASKEAVLNYIMLDQVIFFIHIFTMALCLRRSERGWRSWPGRRCGGRSLCALLSPGISRSSRCLSSVAKLTGRKSYKKHIMAVSKVFPSVTFSYAGPESGYIEAFQAKQYCRHNLFCLNTIMTKLNALWWRRYNNLRFVVPTRLAIMKIRPL